MSHFGLGALGLLLATGSAPTDDARNLERRADILAARGDTAAAREALEQALSLVESLPPGGRRDFQSKPLKEKLEALSRSAASPGTA